MHRWQRPWPLPFSLFWTLCALTRSLEIRCTLPSVQWSYFLGSFVLEGGWKVMVRPRLIGPWLGLPNARKPRNCSNRVIIVVLQLSSAASMIENLNDMIPEPPEMQQKLVLAEPGVWVVHSDLRLFVDVICTADCETVFDANRWCYANVFFWFLILHPFSLSFFLCMGSRKHIAHCIWLHFAWPS